MDDHDDLASQPTVFTDEIKDDCSVAPTEASSTGADESTDLDENCHIIPDELPPTHSTATISTAATLVAILSVLVALRPSFFICCGKLLASFFPWYLATLEEAPLLTKCITGSLLAIVGDYAAQRFECKLNNAQQHRYESYSALQNFVSTLTIGGMYDYRRGCATVLETFLLSCPLQHYAYDFFESVLPIENSLAAMIHVVLDCVALDCVFVASGIVVGGILEGHSLTTYVIPNLKKNYSVALKAALVTNISFAPVEFVTFRFLPLPLRVLSLNAVDLVWDGVVSFATHGGAVAPIEIRC